VFARLDDWPLVWLHIKPVGHTSSWVALNQSFILGIFQGNTKNSKQMVQREAA